MELFNNDILLNLCHLHSLQVENCESDLRPVVDGDDNSKFRLERVKVLETTIVALSDERVHSEPSSVKPHPLTATTLD